MGGEVAKQNCLPPRSCWAVGWAVGCWLPTVPQGQKGISTSHITSLHYLYRIRPRPERSNKPGQCPLRSSQTPPKNTSPPISLMQPRVLHAVSLAAIHKQVY